MPSWKRTIFAFFYPGIKRGTPGKIPSLNNGIPCLGPITADGCGSVCPNHNLPCQGCWGPAEGANPTSEFFLLKEKGFDIEAIKKRMSNYSGTKLAEFFEQFKKESK
jgi:coenzyme F420-reducing hydrogenase gamma subunit